jgi:hypothetical protein
MGRYDPNGFFFDVLFQQLIHQAFQNLWILWIKTPSYCRFSYLHRDKFNSDDTSGEKFREAGKAF